MSYNMFWEPFIEPINPLGRSFRICFRDCFSSIPFWRIREGRVPKTDLSSSPMWLQRAVIFLSKLAERVCTHSVPWFSVSNSHSRRRKWCTPEAPVTHPFWLFQVPLKLNLLDLHCSKQNMQEQRWCKWTFIHFLTFHFHGVDSRAESYSGQKHWYVDSIGF